MPLRIFRIKMWSGGKVKKNLFKLFTNKLLDYPLWVKQAVFQKLAEDLDACNCKDAKQENFALYEPVITFEGENELKNKRSILDRNICNFLKLCHENYSLLEISLNTFLSLEETCKIFMFCVEQNYVRKPEQKAVYAFAGFIAGKFRTGEYFLECGIITKSQLAQAVEIRENSSKAIGEILTEMNFITKDNLKFIFETKADASKRFVLDANIYPESELQISEKEKLQSEINSINKENEMLRQRMRSLIQMVSNKND